MTPVPRAVRGDGDYDVHTVQYGDSLAGVARAYGTSVDALCETNGIRFGDRDFEEEPALYVGQRLLIPMESRGYEDVDGIGRRGSYGASTVRTPSEQERDAEFERARRARSERHRMTSPATQTHSAVSSAVEELSRDQVAGLLSHRDETILLLAETTNCRWCDEVQPAWTAVAVCYANDPTVRVCRLKCEGNEMKQFAAKYFRAKTFPTIVALPTGKGPVYRHASSDRSVAALLEFAEEATGRSAPTLSIDVRKSMNANYGAAATKETTEMPVGKSESATPHDDGRLNTLTGALGRALGIDSKKVQATESVKSYSTTSPAAVQFLPFVAGGLVITAVFAAFMNIAVAVQTVGRTSDPSPKHRRRLGRHFHEEEFAPEHEPMDDYQEALMEVSEQDDMEELADWKRLVVEELFSLPGRALLLIRIWFLIGRRNVELQFGAGRRRTSRTRRPRSFEDEVDIRQSRDYYDDRRNYDGEEDYY